MEPRQLSTTKLRILELAQQPTRWTDLLNSTVITRKALFDHLNQLQEREMIRKDKNSGLYSLTERGRKELVAGRELLEKERKKGRFERILDLAAKCEGAQATDLKKYLIHLYPDVAWISSTYGTELKSWKRTGQWKRFGEVFAELTRQEEALVRLDNELHQFLGEAFGPGWRHEVRYKKGTGWSPFSDSAREAERLSEEIELPGFDPELKYTPRGVGNYPEDFLTEATLKAWNDAVDHALKMLKGAVVAIDKLGPAKGAPFAEALEFLELKDSLEKLGSILQESFEVLGLFKHKTFPPNAVSR